MQTAVNRQIKGNKILKKRKRNRTCHKVENGFEKKDKFFPVEIVNAKSGGLWGATQHDRKPGYLQ